jgi:hypothetical protein
MMGWIALMAFGSLAQADRIIATAVACPDMEAFKRISEIRSNDKIANKELYVMQQGCQVLTPNDKISVIDPEHRVHGEFVRILVDKTNDILYIRARYLKIEQSGSGNIFKF